jgi:hypothetical protein
LRIVFLQWSLLLNMRRTVLIGDCIHRNSNSDRIRINASDIGIPMSQDYGFEDSMPYECNPCRNMIVCMIVSFFLLSAKRPPQSRNHMSIALVVKRTKILSTLVTPRLQSFHSTCALRPQCPHRKAISPNSRW